MTWKPSYYNSGNTTNQDVTTVIVVRVSTYTKLTILVSINLETVDPFDVITEHPSALHLLQT
jgi:hypothetical protein